jgi:hypothetical protein
MARRLESRDRPRQFMPSQSRRSSGGGPSGETYEPQSNVVEPQKENIARLEHQQAEP